MSRLRAPPDRSVIWQLGLWSWVAGQPPQRQPLVVGPVPSAAVATAGLRGTAPGDPMAKKVWGARGGRHTYACE